MLKEHQVLLTWLKVDWGCSVKPIHIKYKNVSKTIQKSLKKRTFLYTKEYKINYKIKGKLFLVELIKTVWTFTSWIFTSVTDR